MFNLAFISIFHSLLQCHAIKFGLHSLTTPIPVFNLSYYIILNIDGKNFSMALDFTTSHFFLFSTNCNCSKSSNFAPGMPKDFEVPSKLPTDDIELEYKGLNLIGYHKVYGLKDGNTTIELDTFVVEKSSGLFKNFTLDGVIGLHIQNKTKKDFSYQIIGESGHTNFALVLSSAYINNFESFIEFGVDDIKEFFQGKQRKKDLKDGSLDWELYTTRFSTRDYLYVNHTYGEFDVNSEKIKFPPGMFEGIFDIMNSSFENLDQNLSFPCKEKEIDGYSYVEFKIQRSLFPLRPRNFLKFNNGRCEFLFEINTEEKWVFGEPFFKDYFSRFDFGSRSITFYQLDTFVPGFYEIAIATFIGLVFVLSLCVGWCLTGRPSPKSNSIYLEPLLKKTS